MNMRDPTGAFAVLIGVTRNLAAAAGLAVLSASQIGGLTKGAGNIHRLSDRVNVSIARNLAKRLVVLPTGNIGPAFRAVFDQRGTHPGLEATVRLTATGIFRDIDGNRTEFSDPEPGLCQGETTEGVKFEYSAKGALGRKKVWLCDAFYRAGLDEQAETIVHEVAHNNGASLGKEFEVYGPRSQWGLATAAPGTAVENAQNYVTFFSYLKYGLLPAGFGPTTSR